MPYCKNCGARITKFEKDLCPVCGAKKPLEGASSDTVEITTEINVHDKSTRQVYDAHFRLTTFILFSLVGFTGAGLFYLKYRKYGLMWLATNILVLGGLIALFGLLISFTSWIPYVASVSIIYLINIASGICFLVKKDIKDGNGEFIR